MGNEIFGLDEEKREEIGEETVSMKRKPYVVWPVGEREYKLKLTTSAIIKLEEKYKANLLNLITGEGLPPIGLLLTVIQAAMQKYEHGISGSAVQDIYDDYVDEGGNITSLLSDVILPLLGNAGFFTENQTEEMKEDLKSTL